MSRHNIRCIIQVVQAMIEVQRKGMVDLKPKTEEEFARFAGYMRDVE